MTKISFDVDFNQDPDKILQEIQKRAEAEVAKREAKDKEKNYLSKLHEVVNKEIGSDFKNINALIRALTKYASPSVRNKIDSTTPSGRRKTISMNKEIYDEIKTLLSKPNPNKSAIARETGVSVVQVRKVAEGGYDEKYGKILSSGKAPLIQKPETAGDDLPPIEDSEPVVDEPTLPSVSSVEEDTIVDDLPTELPPITEISDSVEDKENTVAPPANLPPPPSLGDDSHTERAGDLTPVSASESEDSAELPPPPSPIDEIPTAPADLPPAPSFGDDSPSLPEQEDLAELPPPPAPLEVASTPGDLPPPPSFDDSDDAAGDLPAPPPPIEAPSLPEEVPPPPVPEPAAEEELPAPPAPAPVTEDIPPAPPAPPPAMDAPPPAAPPAPTSPPKPSLSGKPTLSLKKGKSKTKGLKLTRPPLKKKLPPPS